MGIPAAVVPLVVVQDDGGGVAQGAGLLEDHLADLRVLRHHAPLGRGEVAGLGQDLVGDGQLAEVVQEAGGPDPLQLAPGQVDGVRERDRCLGDQVRRLPRVRGPACERCQERLLGRPHGLAAHVQRPVACLGRDGRPPDRAVVARLPEHVDLVASERLGRVEGGVRIPHQHVGREDVTQAPRDTGGQGDRHHLPVRQLHRGPGHDPPELLGDGRGGVGVGLGQHDQELLAPVAAGRVDGADVRREECAHMAQHRVAGGMAMGVVEALEVVEVGQDDRQRVPEPARPLVLLVHATQHGLAVRDAGERVDRREAPGVRHAIGQGREGEPEPAVADRTRVDRHEGALVLRGRQVLGERGQASVLAADDQRREPGGPGERPHQGDERSGDEGGGQEIQRSGIPVESGATTPLSHPQGNTTCRRAALPWGDGPSPRGAGRTGSHGHRTGAAPSWPGSTAPVPRTHERPHGR